MTAPTLDSVSFPTAAVGDRAQAREDARQKTIINLLTADLALCVMAQKIAVIADIQVPLLIHMAFVGFMLIRGLVEISTTRLLLFLLFAVWALVCHAFFPIQAFSVNSLLLVLGLYFLYVFVAPIDKRHYGILANRFVILAGIATVLCFADWGLQAVGLGKPNMELYVPYEFLYQSYDYTAPLRWDEPWIRPNGFFFLERSHLAQFIAIGMIIETVYKRRLWLLAFMAAGVLSTVSGTGSLLLLLTVPFLLYRIDWRIILAILVIVVGASAALSQNKSAASYVESTLGRTEEFGREGSSGYNRFVLPAVRLSETWQSPQAILTGVGAGTMPQLARGVRDGAAGFAWPPYTKMGEEYGLIALALWLVFFGTCILNRGIPFPIIWVMILQLQLMGGTLAVPIHTVYCILLAAGFRITDATPRSTLTRMRRTLSPLLPRGRASGGAAVGTE